MATAAWWMQSILGLCSHTCLTGLWHWWLNSRRKAGSTGLSTLGQSSRDIQTNLLFVQIQQGVQGAGTTARHIVLPKDRAKLVLKTRFMSQSEWRNLGVQQSQGWVHYMIHEPEPHILPLRRPLKKWSGRATFQSQALHKGPCFLPSFWWRDYVAFLFLTWTFKGCSFNTLSEVSGFFFFKHVLQELNLGFYPLSHLTLCFVLLTWKSQLICHVPIITPPPILWIRRELTGLITFCLTIPC